MLYKFWSFDGEHMDVHVHAWEAEKVCQDALTFYREEAAKDEEWSDCVEAIRWGPIAAQTVEINSTEDACDYALVASPLPQSAEVLDAWAELRKVPGVLPGMTLGDAIRHLRGGA